MNRQEIRFRVCIRVLNQLLLFSILIRWRNVFRNFGMPFRSPTKRIVFNIRVKFVLLCAISSRLYLQWVFFHFGISQFVVFSEFISLSLKLYRTLWLYILLLNKLENNSILPIQKLFQLQENNSDVVRHILDCVQHLQINCMGLQNANNSADEQLADNYIQKVRQCAYEIAKDTKLLVTKYTSQ